MPDVANDHWTFRIYAKNLADEQSYSNIGTSLGGLTNHWAGTPIQPRTYGLGG